MQKKSKNETDSPQFQEAVSVPLKLPAWELAGDLDLEARVLIGLRPGVQRVSVRPSGVSVALALGGRPWRSGGADVCAEALSWHHEGWFR